VTDRETVSIMVTVLLLPELKSLANMARLLQKKDVISALASF
jgi:hypothetical protein